MYINTLSSEVSGFRQYLRGIHDKAKTRVTTVGEFRDIHIAIDNFKNSKGETLQKRYVLWNKDIQLIWYKNKSENGKFELLV